MRGFAAGIAAVGIALGGAAFAGTEVGFENKLYMEDAFWGRDGESGESARLFAPLKDKIDLTLESERLSAEVKATTTLQDTGGEVYAVSGELNDAWVEFRPVEEVGLAWGENIVSWASNLPIYDDDLQSGNIASTGFTAWYAPQALGGALKVAATLPYDWSGEPNFLNGEGEGGEGNRPNFGIGAAYSHELFEATFSAGNIASAGGRRLGGSVGFPNLLGLVEGLGIGFGFERNKAGDGFGDFINYLTVEAGVRGKTLLNAVATYESDTFSATAEAVTNFGEDTTLADSTHDLYAAAEIDIKAGERLTAIALGKVAADFTKSDEEAGIERLETAFAFGVGAAFAVAERHEVGAGFEMGFMGESRGIAVPVYWKYSY